MKTIKTLSFLLLGFSLAACEAPQDGDNTTQAVEGEAPGGAA